MKLISWNVNGLRAALKKGLLDFVAAERPDVLCVQETKCAAEDVSGLLPTSYTAHFASAEKKGYAGVLTLSRREPLRVTRGLGLAAHDREGRVLTSEFADFFLVNVYVPNSQRELTRLPYRQEWDRAFLHFLRTLERQKPVIFCGDLNVAHTELDLARPRENVRNHGFTPEERAGFASVLEAGFIDTFREFEQAGGHYTWWSQMNRARQRNIGWRIDYFLCSAALRPQLKSARIYPHILGSDHCPVGLELKRTRRIGAAPGAQ